MARKILGITFAWPGWLKRKPKEDKGKKDDGKKKVNGGESGPASASANGSVSATSAGTPIDPPAAPAKGGVKGGSDGDIDIDVVLGADVGKDPDDSSMAGKVVKPAPKPAPAAKTLTVDDKWKIVSRRRDIASPAAVLVTRAGEVKGTILERAKSAMEKAKESAASRESDASKGCLELWPLIAVLSALVKGDNTKPKHLVALCNSPLSWKGTHVTGVAFAVGYGVSCNAFVPLRVADATSEEDAILIDDSGTTEDVTPFVTGTAGEADKVAALLKELPAVPAVNLRKQWASSVRQTALEKMTDFQPETKAAAEFAVEIFIALGLFKDRPGPKDSANRKIWVDACYAFCDETERKKRASIADVPKAWIIVAHVFEKMEWLKKKEAAAAAAG